MRTNAVWYDTESICFLGPTMMIQYALSESPDDIHLVDIFNQPAIKTLELLDSFMSRTLVGYNLAHDSYHLARTFNILAHLQYDKIPDPYEYREVEMDIKSKEYCLKPKGAVDLLIIGRQSKEFQNSMKQKTVIVRKVPKVVCKELIMEMNLKFDLPPILFAKDKQGYHWRTQEINILGEPITPQDYKAIEKGRYHSEIDPDFVNLRLVFRPGAGLKDIAKHLCGFTDTEAFEIQGGKYDELGWYPGSGNWIHVFEEHKLLWLKSKKKREYAKRDVVYTQAVDRLLDYPEPDEDSMLATLVGNTYWSGYTIDTEEVDKQLQHTEKKMERIKRLIQVNYNSSKKVKEWLHSSCNYIEKLAIDNTRKDTIKILTDSENKELRSKARLLLAIRDEEMSYRVLRRLQVVKRLHVTFNVSGTRTYRMSGGDSLEKAKGGSINPQGIKKGIMRKIFTFYNKEKGEVLSAGDFSGFEVSIYAAVYNDPKLNEELASNKKIHAIWGSFIYNMPYEDVLATDGIKGSEPKGFYQRAKGSFFAALYGAQAVKIAEVTWLEQQEVELAYKRFYAEYTTVGKAQQQLENDHKCIDQPGGVGTAVKWVNPKRYTTSFLGYDRSFDLEYSVIEILFSIAEKLPKSILDKGKQYTVYRKEDRAQKASGAVRSALFGACGNMMSQIMRVAGNFNIQSPGGVITKRLQSRISEFQPTGIHEFYIKLFNVHDEIQCVSKEELVDDIRKAVTEFKIENRKLVPLLEIEWDIYNKNWKEQRLKIFKIEQSEFGGYCYFYRHIIAASTKKEVIALAKEIAENEGERAWDTAEIEELGVLTKDTTEPYIISSSFQAG